MAYPEVALFMLVHFQVIHEKVARISMDRSTLTQLKLRQFVGSGHPTNCQDLKCKFTKGTK